MPTWKRLAAACNGSWCAARLGVGQLSFFLRSGGERADARRRWRSDSVSSWILILSCLSCAALAQSPSRARATTGAATSDFQSAPAAELQSALTRAMAGRSGSAVVVDVDSGKIIAAHHPAAAARRLARPGSAIKPFVLLALLRNGKTGADTRLMCRRTVEVGGHHLDCTHPETGVPLNSIEALAYSCNSWFIQNAARLTSAELRDALVQAGLTSRTRAVPDETTGNVNEAGTLEQRELQSVGEYGIEVTPLELLWAYRGVAQASKSGDRDSSLKTVAAGLEASIRYGMAQKARVAGMDLAGKTGTALADEGSWTHGWFAGYAPADRPEIALVVFLERGRGPTDAAAIAGQIFSAYFAGHQKMSSSRNSN